MTLKEIGQLNGQAKYDAIYHNADKIVEASLTMKKSKLAETLNIPFPYFSRMLPLIISIARKGNSHQPTTQQTKQ